MNRMTVLGETYRRRRRKTAARNRGGSSQAKVLVQDGTLESFSQENTEGEGNTAKSLRLQDRGSARLERVPSVFLFYLGVALFPSY